MGKDLKDTWKEAGKGIGFAFRDLGKAIIKTGATALNKANEWANNEDGEEQEKKAQDDKKS